MSDTNDDGDDLENDGRVNYKKTPFPWYGGKSQAAPLVWQLLGDCVHYVEPFFGGGAVLLNRPHPCNRPYYSETVNDLDGLVVNAWRAMQFHPEETARHASWPVSELDKNARQIHVLKWRKDKNYELLAGTHDYCDPLIAGWWLWGTCVQIGAFDGNAPWTADPVTGRIRKWKDIQAEREPGVARDLPHISKCGQGVNHPNTREPGVARDRPNIGDDGKGVTRPQLREPGVARDLPHIGDNGQGVNRPQAREPGVRRNLPHIGDNGRGVNRPQLREPGVTRSLPYLGDNGRGVNHASTREPGVLSDDPANEFHPLTMPELVRWFQWLSARLRHVRIINGDWSRVCTTGAAHTLPVRQGKGPCAVFLDPPYSAEASRNMTLYAMESGTVAHDVREWCVKNGGNPKFRIVLAGFDSEHTELESHGWSVHEWFAAGHLRGGMGNVKKDKSTGGHQQKRERLWASPHCLPIGKPQAEQGRLFDGD
jgi:DNA adenine methylase